MKVYFPKTAQVASARASDGASVRAGATDLHERRHVHHATNDLVDLRDIAGLDEIEGDKKGMRIGAKVRLADLAAHPTIRVAYPGLAMATAALATPQIRAVATVAGNLLQDTRCWYYRSPDHPCLRRGGTECLAREGDHLYHACFEQSSCVSVHPSTVGLALMAYEASVHLADGTRISIAELYAPGVLANHNLSDGQIVIGVSLPAPMRAEKAAYFRSTSRARAEWPLVEVLALLELRGNHIASARVAMGGVANMPMRLPAVEKVLSGQAATPEVLAKAAQRAAENAAPLPMTQYKVRLIAPTVLEALERAVQGGSP